MNNLIPKPFLQKNNSSTIKPIDEGMRGFIPIPILFLLLLLLVVVVVVVLGNLIVCKQIIMIKSAYPFELN